VLSEKSEALRQELLSHSNILSVSNSSSLPGRHFNANSYRMVGTPASEKHMLYTMYADEHLARVLDLKMAAGRFFSSEIAGDESAVIINETAARQLGLQDPLGTLFYKEYGNAREGEYATVIGVVSDIHFHSLHNRIEPMLFRCLKGGWGRFTSIRISPDNIRETVQFIKNIWNRFSGGQPFECSFLDDDFAQLYDKDRKTGKIYVLFSILGMFIACLGILGLAAFLTERRTREIGIRKVLGAGNAEIAALLSFSFFKWIFAALLLAWPLAYFFFRHWLNNFAYRIPLGISPFLFSGLLALVFAAASTGFQTVKAARADPVRSLKHE
jgi:putative ABC transport system permease protein